MGLLVSSHTCWEMSFQGSLEGSIGCCNSSGILKGSVRVLEGYLRKHSPRGIQNGLSGLLIMGFRDLGHGIIGFRTSVLQLFRF